MARLVAIPRLTLAQEQLVKDLADSDTGGLFLRGPYMRIGDRLAWKGLAKKDARWYELTERGREVADKLPRPSEG